MTVKNLLAVLLVIVVSFQVRASGPGDGWSEMVDGLRARLLLQREPKSPFLKVFIEFQNTAGVAGAKKIRFEPGAVELRVGDAANTPLAKANRPYDGTSPLWEPLLLPCEGTLRFRISFPGLGYQPKTDRTILDLGPSMSWVIPEDKEYFVSGTLTIAKRQGDHPLSDWAGTLILPSTRIPAAGKGESDADPAPGRSNPGRVSQTPAGINQLVENRAGRLSCWGVVIRLGSARFSEVIRPEQMMIRERKHGRDLRGLMFWQVGQGGKQLVIKFKPGMGDFGSGNSVEVQVDRSALKGEVDSPDNRFEWSINTDVL